MQGHIQVGREYPGVDNHTTYSFGLDDQEFVVAFDTDDVGTFLDLVQRLRTTEASAYTVRDTPSFTCLAMSLARALNALDGEPVGVRGGAARCLIAAAPICAAADPVLAELIARGRHAAQRARWAPGQGGPLRRAGAHDRRPAAVGERRARDLRTADGALRRAPAHAAGDPRRRARRAARRRGALAREGRLSQLARRARALGRAGARAAGRARRRRGDRGADRREGPRRCGPRTCS